MLGLQDNCLGTDRVAPIDAAIRARGKSLETDANRATDEIAA